MARSTFPSTKHYMFAPLLEVRMLKSASRCGAKHISKSKCTKHHMFAPLLEVRMLKKCTPLWREAHFEVKMQKHTPASDHFWKLRCRKSARRCEVKMYKTLGVRTTFGGSDVASLQDTTLQNVTLHYTPVHYITLHYTPVHSTTLNYTTPHYITLNDTATQIDR